MKILVVSNLYPPDIDGGYELGCSQAVGALRGRGHDVRVLTSAPRRPLPAAEGVQRDLTLANVYDPDLGDPDDRRRRLALNVAAMWIDAPNTHRLLAAAREFEPDVVYLWNLVGIGGLGLVTALQEAGIPWAWHLMDQVPVILSGLRDAPRPALARLFAGRLDGTYISCSEHVLEEIKRKGLSLKGRVAVIPNWIHGARPQPSHRTRDAGGLRIAMASAVNRDKGVDVMMRAAALLRERGFVDFKVDVYGRLVDSSLVGLVEELGIGDCFFLKGEVPHADLVAMYGRYDLFAFPVWEREPFAFAALEAAAQGCPVLMTHGGNAEWFVDGVHCLKAQRTPEAFAARLQQVISGQVDAAAIGERGQRVVLRDFHIDTVVPRIEEALSAAAAGRDHAGSHDRAYVAALLAHRLAAAIVDEVPLA